MESVHQLYHAIRDRLRSAELDALSEPFSHVAEVERLRCFYRPQTDVRLLVIGESHVRVSDETFERRGPAFLYNEHYYTPWWRHLFLPAFAPGLKQANATTRLQLLGEMRHRGVWVLDASIIALSGYSKIDAMWPNRPFDSLRATILQLSWKAHVRFQVEPILNQRVAPIVCALGSVAAVLPDFVRDRMIRLNCFGPANAAIYRQTDYQFGTEAFVRAVSNI